MTDNYDVPGGNRGETTRTVASGSGSVPAPGPKSDQSNWEKRSRCAGADKFPMTRWWHTWVDCTSVWDTIHTSEPYPIKGLICSTGNFMNQSNATYGYEALGMLEFTMYIDMWMVPGANMADVLLPCQHWLEVPGFPRTSQGASGGLGLTAHCIEPPAETKFEEEIMCAMYQKFGMPFYDTEDGGDAWDRPMEAWLDSTVKSIGMTWEEFYNKFQEEGWIDCKEFYPERWGTYRRYLMGYLRGRDSTPFQNIPGN